MRQIRAAGADAELASAAMSKDAQQTGTRRKGLGKGVAYIRMEQPGSENAGRVADWQRLEELCSRATNSGLGSLNGNELWEFPSLYRRVLADVSLLRSNGG